MENKQEWVSAADPFLFVLLTHRPFFIIDHMHIFEGSPKLRTFGSIMYVFSSQQMENFNWRACRNRYDIFLYYRMYRTSAVVWSRFSIQEKFPPVHKPVLTIFWHSTHLKFAVRAALGMVSAPCDLNMRSPSLK